MNKLNLIASISLSIICLHAFADNSNYNNATNAGQSLGSLLSNQGASVVSSDSGDNALDALGTNVTATGSESSMQKSNMGAAGTLSSSFNFAVKPKCIDTGYYPLLHGSYIKVPCSNSTGLIAASICINDENNSVDCNVSTNYRPINLPTNGNTVTDYGYQFTGKCDADGYCNGEMTQNAQVSTNADNINQQSIDTAKKSGLYDMIASGYVGKDGYSKQQAYMKSFGDGGSNNIFAKCTNDISGVLQNGVYYSCDHNESDSFSGQCTTQKVCTDWELIHHDTVINKTCTLTSGSKDIQCQRQPTVTVTEEPYQATANYSGQLASPTPTTGQIIPPESGHITYARVSLFNYGNNIYSCFQSYWGVIGGLRSNSFHPRCGGGTDGSGFVFTNSPLNISATANQPITWTLGCSTGGCSSSVAASRAWAITMQVTRYKKVAHVTWSTQCPNI